MLDDLKMIHERDRQDALGVAEKQNKQLAHKYEVDLDDLIGKTIDNVVVVGMGGSALAASLVSTWPALNVPYEVVRDYHIPKYVGPNTLLIASSYSGNTEETLSATSEAAEKGCHIVVIAAGGKLAELAEQNKYPIYLIPEGYQPRMAVMYNFAALTQLFSDLKLVPETSVKELIETAAWLETEVKSLLPTVPTRENLAKKLALDLVGNSVVVYSGPQFAPAAYKWKINFNENAKNVAWWGTLPEFNHNEFLGWTEQPNSKPYKVIDLRSSLENPRVQKRFKVTEKLLSGRRPAPIVVEARGENLLQQLLYTVQLGDFVSLYLALLNGLNPTPVDLIEKFKTQLQ